MRILLILAALATPALASAQTPILPGQLISFEVNPGTKLETPTGTTVIQRPEANVVFEYRIDAAATPVPAVKASACTPVTAGSLILTCRLRPPSLSAGTHTIEVRALASPAEPDIAPSGFSTPLSVAAIIVTAPGTPSNTRVTSQP